MFCQEVVTLPFSNDQLRDKFNNTYDSYVIDYKKSNIKNIGFLSYLRNANIEAVIIDVDKTLIENYITSGNMIPNSNLSLIHADLLFLEASNGTSVHSGCIFDFLTKDEIDDVLKSMKEVLKQQVDIITFLPLYLLVHCKLNEGIEDNFLTYNKNDDPIISKIGKTWVQVATKPNVMSMLINITHTAPSDMVYYSCFDEFAFNGNTLFGALGQMQDYALSLLFDNISLVMTDGHTTDPQ